MGGCCWYSGVTAIKNPQQRENISDLRKHKNRDRDILVLGGEKVGRVSGFKLQAQSERTPHRHTLPFFLNYVPMLDRFPEVTTCKDKVPAPTILPNDNSCKFL